MVASHTDMLSGEAADSSDPVLKSNADMQCQPDDSPTDGEQITDSMRTAQLAAESEVEEAELSFQQETIEQAATPAVPRLLQSFQSGAAPDIQGLAAKTQELKAKGHQLDLLLLKAETYSHFIRENQERCRRNIDSGHFGEACSDPAPATTSSSSKKRKSPSPSNASKPATSGRRSKSSRKSVSSSPGTSADSAVDVNGDDDTSPDESTSSFKVTSLLVGGKLMSYQVEGLKWLLSLWENGLSGILADEMGLGKTIQIISLIAQLRAAGTPGPFLIAGPLATLPNWMNEFKKWLPSCPVVLYHGTREERAEMRRSLMQPHRSKDMSFPVVVTSFEICMIDRPHLERYMWQYIILDEGHRIKNRNCRLVRELKQLPSTSRLLLTGTPIQNTLEELWSLLNFVNPMIFDNLEVFQSWFGFRNIGKETKVDEIVDNEQQQRIVSKLHEILRPFLLRRMKTDVLTKMPPKREVVIYCPMSSLQKEYYTRVADGSIRDTLVCMGIERARDTSQMNMVMNLRKVCNHPFLFGEPRDPASGQYLGELNPALLVLASGKFKLLDRMLPRLKAQGHKVLIFSQMTQLLDILHDYLLHKGYDMCRLDGSTKVADRQQQIDHFNSSSECFCFLLSTRAGGLGINLASADTCILFDSDWNPHQDLQAQDRCHRIGQKKEVAVYRFLTAGSVEIDVMEKQISKKKLDRMTMHGGDFRQAGRRQSEEMSLSYLRKLLEDDVHNLSRMMGSGAAGRRADAGEMLRADGDAAAAGGIGGSEGVACDISDAELELLLERDKLFAINEVTGEYAIPPEGDMYDVVVTTGSSLQGVE